MSLRRRFLWMVLFALLIAQTMGLMHRVVHVPVFGADSSVHIHAPFMRAVHSQGWADALFAGHDGEPAAASSTPGSAGGCLPYQFLPAVLLPVTAPLFFSEWFRARPSPATGRAVRRARPAGFVHFPPLQARRASRPGACLVMFE